MLRVKNSHLLCHPGSSLLSPKQKFQLFSLTVALGAPLFAVQEKEKIIQLGTQKNKKQKKEKKEQRKHFRKIVLRSPLFVVGPRYSPLDTEACPLVFYIPLQDFVVQPCVRG